MVSNLCKNYALAVAVGVIIGLGACGTVRAQGTQDLPGTSGTLCTSEDALGYIEKQDGSIDFIYRMFLPEAICGVWGNAQPNSSGWTYSEENCTFSISVENGAVRFSTNGPNDCRDHCGFKGHMDGRSLPITTLKRVDITSGDLEPETFFSYKCPQ